MGRQKKLIIEARVNEYAMRNLNRNVPWSPDEIADAAAECREAGASIVHFHPRDSYGLPGFEYELYRETVDLIHQRSDILIHPTLGWAAVEAEATAEQRLSNVVHLARDGYKIEFAPLDMGSTNADLFDPRTGQFSTEENVYINTAATLRYFAEQLRKYKIRPNPVIWNLSMMRTLDIFMNNGLIEEPAYVLLGLSDGDSLVTHPGTLRGLMAYLDFLPKGKSIEWTTGLYGGNLFPLIGSIIELDGHIAIGLGDYSYSALGEPTNADLVKRVAQFANDCECEIATPADARKMLGVDVVH